MKESPDDEEAIQTLLRLLRLALRHLRFLQVAKIGSIEVNLHLEMLRTRMLV